MSATRNPMCPNKCHWRDGIVREEDHWRCRVCGCVYLEKTLAAHHDEVEA